MYGLRLILKVLSSHQSLNRKGRWGTTDDFATSFSYVGTAGGFLAFSVNVVGVEMLL